MAPQIGELFPFGDLDSTVIERATERFPDLPAAELTAVFELAKAAVDMLESMARPVEEVGMTPAQWRLIVALAFQSGEQGAAVGELARHLGVRPPTATSTVRRAEESGLVRRVPDPDDRRMVRVVLSERGDDRLVNLHGVLAARLAALVHGLGGVEKVRRLTKALSNATESLD